MDLVVVVDPALDGGQGSRRIGDRVHADMVALEGPDEGFGHAVALGALDGREAGREAECRGSVERLGGGIDRAVVGESLDLVLGLEGAEAALDAADHQVTDHPAAAAPR